jgi:adenine-specific DNA-methyltransferase
LTLKLLNAYLEAFSVTKPGEEIAKFDLQSHDIVETRQRELLRLFPEVHTESGGINFDALRTSLGDAVSVGPEGFGMSWPGKAECARVIQQQSLATLLPVVDESVNWDTTQNVIIEGDNLEVLKVLQKAYLGKVKMIYIDPPYNTGNDFIYPDNFTESLKTYLQYTGQVDDEGRKFSTNTESSGRFHSKWMNMMYPRLNLARDLLTDDGVIFISIDDHEVENLLRIGKEIFGEHNHATTFIWQKKKKPSFLHANVGSMTEYVIAFTRNNRNTFPFSIDTTTEGKKYPLNNAGNGIRTLHFPPKSVSFVDSDAEFVPQDMSEGNIHCRLLEKLIVKNHKNVNEIVLEGEWRYSQDKLDSIISAGELITISKVPFRPNHVKVGGEIKKMHNLLTPQTYNIETNEDATAHLSALMGGDYFDNPKPVGLIKTFVKAVTYDDPDAIVLDFFAGSGSTAEAVMSQNQEDGGHRKFLLVQLPEPTLEDSIAFKSGLESITSITRKRVTRAASELQSRNLDTLDEDLYNDFDFGFRSFRLNESNFAVWDAGMIKGDEKKLEQQLFAQVEHVLPGRTHQDILFELMLKSRFQLTTPLESELVGKCEAWKVASGEMVVVLDSGLTVEVVREIASWKPLSVVILDRCFSGDDSLKANARKIFEDAKVDLKTV